MLRNNILISLIMISLTSCWFGIGVPLFESKKNNTGKELLSDQNNQKPQIKGTWKVVDYTILKKASINKKEAKKWIGKHAIISDQVSFNHQYNDLPAKPCQYYPVEKKEEIEIEKYFKEKYGINPKKIGIKDNKVTRLSIGCKDTPFETGWLTRSNELHITYHGVFFKLIRE